MGDDPSTELNAVASPESDDIGEYKKVYVLVEIRDYKGNGSPSRLADYFSALVMAGIGSKEVPELRKRYGSPTIGPMVLATDEDQEFIATFPVRDLSDASVAPSKRLGPEIEVALCNNIGGPCLVAATRANQVLGEVLLDYFDDKLQVCVYLPEHQDEPFAKIVLVQEVSTRS